MTMMLRKFVGTGLVLTALSSGAVAWGAQGDNSNYNDTTNVTQANAETNTSNAGYLTREIVGIKPQVGVVGYNDPNTGILQGRGIYGLTVDVNLMSAIDQNLESFFLGPSVGALYSHLGNPGSGAFGGNSGTVAAGQDGANMLILPADVKVGYNFNNWFRLGAHGGGNVVYNSVASALVTSPNSTAGGGPQWALYPNVGADLEFALGRNIALMIRPDFTLTPGDDIYTGTLAVSFPIG